MQKAVNFGTASLLVASVVLTVLTIVPDVGWMIRQQARMLAGGSITPHTNSPGGADEKILREFPADYLLQLGGAFRTLVGESDNSDQYVIGRFQTLQERFPSEPSLPAHILRYLCTKPYLSHRDAKRYAWTPPGPSPCAPDGSDTAVPCVSTPEPVDIRTPELLEYVAAQGEALDPNNAFFPTMRAVAYLAQERDGEARKALARAATRPFWNDYATEEIQARWRLRYAAHGETGALEKYFAATLVEFWHYPRIRAMARITVTQAAELELQGKTAEGLSLRKSLARIGTRLRTDSPTVGGAVLGGAVTLISASRPGGAPDLSEKEFPDREKRAVISKDRYLAYLNRIGETAEVQWYAAEWARIHRVKAIHERAEKVDNGGLADLSPLVGYWLMSVLLLLNGLWILLLGGFAVLLARTRRIRENQPLSRGMAWGFAYAVVGPLLVGGIYWLNNLLSLEMEMVVYLTVPVLTGLLTIPLFCLKRNTDWRGYGRNAGMFLATIAASLALASLFPLSLHGVLNSEYYESVSSCFYIIPDSPLKAPFMGTGLPLPLLPGFLPALCLIGLAVWSWRRKVPVSVGIVRGFQRISLPLASLLLLAYAFMVIFTLGSEIEVTKSIEERARHEGRYEARIVGEEWPRHPDYSLPPIK